MGQEWYYDFMNPNHAVNACLVRGVMPYEIHYIKDIISTKVGMFTYKNIEKIPDLTSTILETSLMFINNLCFYKSASLGWVLCRYVFGSVYSLYFRPKFVNLMTLKGESVATNVPWEDIILVKDNKMDVIPFLCINDYLFKIQRIEDTIFKVLNNATLPLALVGSKKLAAQFKTIAKKLSNNEPFVAGDDQLVDAVKAFNIDVPVQPLDIYELKQKYKNECLSSLGIYSVEEKRERIVTQELVNQNDYTDFVYQDAKTERARFVAELNK